MDCGPDGRHSWGNIVTSIVQKWFAITLWKRIAAALVLGAIVGLIAGDSITAIQWVGDLFIRLIRMLVVPLVFVTLVAGVVAMDDPKRLGSIGIKAFGLYLVTTLFAIIIGIVVTSIIRPGIGVKLVGIAPKGFEGEVSLTERMLSIVPENPFAAFAQGDVLAIIFFAIMVGAGILMAGEKAKTLGNLFEGAAEVMLKITHIVMECAPFGVFALIAVVMGTAGVSTFLNIFLLAITVYLGCFLHMLLVHGPLVRFAGRLKIVPFFKGIVDAQLVAYSTSSSSGTLPVSLSCAEHNLGIKGPVASSILPLGATVNMDGTALYVAAVTIFAAQIFGIDLNFYDYAMIALTTTLVSVGTASVPSASLFLLTVVLGTIGVTNEQTALIVGFIFPFDRILDMMRTVVNVTGDLAVATTVARMEDEIDVDVYYKEAVE